MKYGQIAGNKSINAMIYRCFELIEAKDIPRFLRKFKQQINDNTQVMHTFRELVLGAYLIASGLRVRYEYSVVGVTPDWCALDESDIPVSIFELVNFHLDRATEDSISAQLHDKGHWVGWQTSNDSRLYSVIQRKFNTYKSIVDGRDLPYVVAVFSEFMAAINVDELNECLYAGEYALFGLYPSLSGVLVFEERSGKYTFLYFPNRNALNKLSIPNGEF